MENTVSIIGITAVFAALGMVQRNQKLETSNYAVDGEPVVTSHYTECLVFYGTSTHSTRGKNRLWCMVEDSNRLRRTANEKTHPIITAK